MKRKADVTATRDLTLTCNAKLGSDGLFELDSGILLDPGGYRITINGTLERVWITKEDVRVREVIHAVEKDRESFDQVVLFPMDLGPPPTEPPPFERLPPIEPRSEWFLDAEVGEPLFPQSRLDDPEAYRRWQLEQAQKRPEDRTPFVPIEVKDVGISRDGWGESPLIGVAKAMKGAAAIAGFDSQYQQRPVPQTDRYGDDFIPPNGVHDATCAYVCKLSRQDCTIAHACTVCDRKAQKEGRIP